MLTSDELKKYAKKELGIDALGIADIGRFDNAPEFMHPRRIMPEVKSVIVFTRRILRGCYRGIERGTHWPSYQVFAYAGLTKLIHQGNYRLGRFIEDHGFEAVPAPPAATLRESGSLHCHLTPPASKSIARSPPAVNIRATSTSVCGSPL